MKKGFIYSSELNQDALLKFIQEFFNGEEVFHIKKDIDKYIPGEGIPEDLSPAGHVFSNKGEIRWEFKDNGMFSILVLADEPASIGFSALDGDWESGEEGIRFVLINPSETPYVSPNFDKYPNDSNFLLAKIYYKDGIQAFVSPRRFLKNGSS